MLKPIKNINLNLYLGSGSRTVAYTGTALMIALLISFIMNKL